MGSRGRLILVTGSTGYVGGRLLFALLARGERVRCLTRRPKELRSRLPERVEIFEADILSSTDLESAFKDVDTGYYMVHSMGASGDFSRDDRQAAKNFAVAAKSAGLRRIIYLGGLGNSKAISEHLRSRQEVGRILRTSGVSTLELRASIIIGSGSLSFEMIRNLVNKLPIMVTPRWVYSLAQPIGIGDVLSYLIESLEIPAEIDGIVEIGGTDKVAYIDIMRAYAKAKGLRRYIVPLPVLSPYLSSLWLGLVTPLYARVGRKIIDSVRHDTIVTSSKARKLYKIRPVCMREAVQRALENEDRKFAETRWSDAVSSSSTIKWGGQKFGSRVVDSRVITILCQPHEAFRPIRRIGGEEGWYYANWLWKLRGLIDLVLGGPGLRRGRRDPEFLRMGDTLDFWRVEDFRDDSLLCLKAEMKVPGRAWLQFEIVPVDRARCVLRQTAIFDPMGLWGLLYWYGIYPLHALVFRGMFKNIIKQTNTNQMSDN